MQLKSENHFNSLRRLGCLWQLHMPDDQNQPSTNHVIHKQTLEFKQNPGPAKSHIRLFLVPNMSDQHGVSAAVVLSLGGRPRLQLQLEVLLEFHG